MAEDTLHQTVLGRSHGLQKVSSDTLSVLFVSESEEKCPQRELIRQVCEQMRYHLAECDKYEEADECLIAVGADVIIIDRRREEFYKITDDTCQIVLSCASVDCVQVFSLCKRNIGHHAYRSQLLQGYSNVLYEWHNVDECVDDMLHIALNADRHIFNVRQKQAFKVALDNVGEAVEIRNHNQVIEYTNSACDKLFGFNSEEIIGTKTDITPSARLNSIPENASLMPPSAQRSVAASGRKNSSPILSHYCRVFPVTDKMGKSRHLVSIMHTISETDNTEQLSSDSVKPGERRRKNSYSKSSDRTPISEIGDIISDVQMESSPAVAQSLERILQLLQSANMSTLFEPSDVREQDAVTASLTGGLGVVSRRPSDETVHHRGSHDYQTPMRRSTRAQSEVLTEHVMQVLSKRNRITMGPTDSPDVPDDIARSMKNDHEWSYDVLELERIAMKRPLMYLGLKVFDRFGVMTFLNTSEAVMTNWLQVIEANYHSSNNYHNSTHAADVLQCSAFLLDRERIKEIFNQADEVASLLSAAVHDLDHPGRTNPFLVNSRNSLATLYNDQAVLESHHVSLAFQLSHKDDRINIFKNMETEAFKSLRKQMIDIVLATEMAKHFEHVNKFVNLTKQFLDEGPTDDSASTEGPFAVDRGKYEEIFHNPENKMLVKRMLIKCSDVSNPCRPLPICKEWALRIAEEYFNQTEEEKARGLPVVMPMFDRNSCSIPKSQIGFVDYFLRTMFTSWHAFCDCPELLSNLHENYQHWKNAESEEQASCD